MSAPILHDWRGELQRYRNTLLNHLLLTGVIVGGIALVLLYTSVFGLDLAIQLQTMLPFAIGWLVILLAWLLRERLGYRARAWILLLLVYVVGCYLMYVNGLVGSGRLWMLFLPIVAVVLLDLWPSGALVGVASVLTYAFFTLTIGLGVFPHEPSDPQSLGHWISEGGDFLIGVVGLTVVVWAFSRGWRGALRRLGEAMGELQVLNLELDQRVNERTHQLAEALAKNEAVLEGIADGVIVFDLDGRAVTANPAVAALLNRSVEEIIGCDVAALVGGADQERVKETLRNGQTTQSGFKFRWEDKIFAVSVAPVRDAAGVTTGTVAVFRDFTQEAEIDRMKSTFVAIASHDLRTPLTAILGFAEMLEGGVYGVLREDQEEVVERIVSNSNYMLSLASNLLGQAQIEAGTLRLELVAFSPREMVRRVVRGMEALAAGKELVLEGGVSEEMPELLIGDAQKLSQILTNLVGNAIKFTDEGTVRVWAYLPDGDHWALAVTDTGPGISQEARAYIFEPFQQGSDKGKKARGAGLGLSIVKRLVVVMSGEVTLESEVGRGSTFTVVLPLLSEGRAGRGVLS